MIAVVAQALQAPLAGRRRKPDPFTELIRRKAVVALHQAEKPAVEIVHQYRSNDSGEIMRSTLELDEIMHD